MLFIYVCYICVIYICMLYMYATNNSVCLYQAWWKQVSIGLGWGLTDFSNVYKDLFPLQVLKTKFASLLIRFIMTICGKCKISSVDFSQCLLRNVFESELLGGLQLIYVIHIDVPVYIYGYLIINR